MSAMPRIPIWAEPRFVALAILVYLAVHFAVRMAMWPTLGIDDSEQALFAQEFSWSYRNQAPPLFTWMLIALGKLLGVNILSISLIRYPLLGIIFGFAYATARRLIPDPRLSALAVYSFAAIYMFAFYSHDDLTHTTMMSAMLAVGWYVFLRLADSPRLGWYLALGAVFGLGLLGKWSYVMFAAALPLACLVVPAYRPLVLSWKTVPTALVCVAIVLPTLLAVIFIGQNPQSTFWGVLVGEGASYLERVVEGTFRLVASAFVYPQPLLPLVFLAFALPLWRGLRRPDPALRGPELTLLVWTMAISLALHLVLVFAFGVRQFYERLMQPPLFILPIALFMLIERGRPSKRSVNAYALILTVLVAGTLAARIVVYMIGADYCGSCRNMAPFRALAEDLREAGYSGGGTIVVDSFPVGGNMRVAFPDARIMDAAYPPRIWPAPRENRPCLLLWQERDPERTVSTEHWLRAYLADGLHASPDAPHREGVVSELMFGSKTREYRLRYVLYEGAAGDCR
jgi:4-amino-4-deoxy-L-arabinose transferase-like glycosyltransferase